MKEHVIALKEEEAKNREWETKYKLDINKLQKKIMFITHDFDEALKLADRIAIMKDGIIEQLDTPAKIVLNPATEYVKKFTDIGFKKEKKGQIKSLYNFCTEWRMGN